MLILTVGAIRVGTGGGLDIDFELLATEMHSYNTCAYLRQIIDSVVVRLQEVPGTVQALALSICCVVVIDPGPNSAWLIRKIT